GTFNFTVQVSDSAHPIQTATKPLSITIYTDLPLSIWPATVSPGFKGGADSSVEMGLKFRSDVPGAITGIRFYKFAENTGPHVGSLWTATGSLLASAGFRAETASGWQQVDFSSPIDIASNTTYVASYHCEGGYYGID